MEHDKFCRFANDNQVRFKGPKCFDCERLSKARQETREEIAQAIEAMPDIRTNIGDVIVGYMSARNQAAVIARGKRGI